MTIDVAAAEQFVHANARLLDRARLAVLIHGAPADRVLDAVRVYRNPDGGFGHALEPDMRCPESQPAVLHVLEVLAGAERLRPHLGADDTVAVVGGTADEKITPVDLSERPGAPSRALFTTEQIERDLDRLESEQQDDGGCDSDFLHWSPGQAVEWRGAITLHSLHTLRANGRISPA